MKEICPTELCTGCSACYSACKAKAITMQKDKYGFEYPEIDPSICLDCGLCKRVCPNNKKLIKTQCISSYVCHAKEEQEQLTSTSGGIASVITRYIIKKGGVVYGCSAQYNMEIKHIRINNENEIDKLKGSKYVQSHIGDIYKNVKNDLLNNKLTLFIGTPCQVAGLKSFLRKEYENLVTIDFVCHGVPSIQYLKDSIGKVNVTNLTPCFRYKFFEKKRNTYKSEYGVYLLSKAKEIVYRKAYPKGLYILGFINALFYRECCYQCHYATPNRISDFTLGDYHDNEGQYNSLPGYRRILSMAMINTIKAEGIWRKINCHVEYSLCLMETIIEKHDQLHKPMVKHKNYSSFRKLYLQYGFKNSVRIALFQEILEYKKKYIKKILMSVLGIGLLKR